ncbi:hypothetical protein F5887DRAFT_1283095 [Amanita rubescens]|nr:hypothetical protein F5887DRAFT_1283095 [Amanita rubescens]
MALPERPEPMNAITHHSNVKVSVTVPDPTFIAGKYVSGKVEMECRADKGLGIGVIMVELFGIQELSSRDHSATSTFLHAQRLFQGPGLPPSNAVQAHAEPGDPPLPSHHYHARRGISTFLFRIPLPVTCPSSVYFGGGLATVRYELRASASVYWRGEKQLVTEAEVGENGKLWMQGNIIGGGIITAGESVCVELQVKNHSSKTNTGLTLTLTRLLVLPSVEKQPLQISDTLTNVAFRGPEYIIHPGVEGVANLVFDIPKTAREVKGGVYLDEGYHSPRETQSLFEVQCIVSVKMTMGIGRDLVLDIPVTVVSPLALPDVLMALPQEQILNAAPAEHFSYPTPISYQDPTPYAPYPAPVSSPPPVALSPSLHIFTAYTDQDQVWLPPPLSPSPSPYVSPIIPLYIPMSPPLVPIQNLPCPHPPPRPASALASTQPYTYSEHISGLPNTAAQHPLLPLNLTAHYESRLAQELNLEPEEGKGERASRVAHHLHMSSRHRSVSPPSHRFPLPQSSPGGANATTVQARALPPPPLDFSSPNAEPVGPLLTTLPDHPGHISPSPSLHSPWPIPSPQMSNTSLPRSERVEELERIAAEEAWITPKSTRKKGKKKQKQRQRQKQIVDSSADINKTLPTPPVPHKSEQDIPMLSEVPPMPIPAPVDRAPPTPTLTAITPARHTRSNNLAESLGPENAESGLGRFRNGDARDLFAGPSIARGVERGVTSPVKESTVASRPTKGRLSPIKIPAPRIGIDIESDGLNLIERRGMLNQCRNKRLHTEAHEDRDSDERTHRAGTVGGKSKSKSSFSGDDAREERKQKKRRRLVPGDVMVDSELEDEAESRGRSREGSMKGKKSSKKKEGHRLRRAVKGRVTAWLGAIDANALPPEEDLIQPSYSEPSNQNPKSESQKGRSPPVTPSLPSEEEAVQPDVPTSAPNPRSSGFMPIAPEKRELEPTVQSQSQRHVMTTSRPYTRATVGDVKGDTSSHAQLGPASIILPSQPRVPSNPGDRGFKSSATDGKNKMGAVKSVLNDLSTVALSAVEQPNGLVWSNKSNAQPHPHLHVPSPTKQQSQDPEVKYDVRSARGGRGGQVTAIAAFWAAAAAKDASKDAASRGTSTDVPSRKQTAPIVAPKPVIAQHINNPRLTERSVTPKPKPVASAKSLDMNKASIPVTDSPPKLLGLAGKTKPATKSSSVPAIVSSSLATPMLSSTASLARPPIQQPRRSTAALISNNFIASVEPSTNKSHGPMKAKSTPDLAFGKAKLRDLIRKYQERGS